MEGSIMNTNFFYNLSLPKFHKVHLQICGQHPVVTERDATSNLLYLAKFKI